MKQCRTCIYWDYQHSWIEEVPINIQFVAGCTECRIAHCRCHCPSTYIVPEPGSPKGFEILSLFPATVANTMCGDYVEDDGRLQRSEQNGREKSEVSG